MKLYTEKVELFARRQNGDRQVFLELKARTRPATSATALWGMPVHNGSEKKYFPARFLRVRQIAALQAAIPKRRLQVERDRVMYRRTDPAGGEIALQTLALPRAVTKRW